MLCVRLRELLAVLPQGWGIDVVVPQAVGIMEE